ncbi:STAS domain-containing protein [Streptomyces erythrochromogenes]|uniref:STAS domain-containing protein n=1 Tax=Streptomyces erythrochromogenes TaxID=285574 RepID=UPI0036C2CF1E
MELPKVAVKPAADDAVVVICSGEFDMDTVGILAAACERDAADAELLVLDVAWVAFADSSFLNELIRLRNTRQMVLAGPLPAQLRRMLEMTGALDLFQVRGHTTADPAA